MPFRASAANPCRACCAGRPPITASTCGASWFVGDILNDVEAGARAGCHTVLLDNGHETEWVRGRWRTPDDVAPDLFMAARLIAQKLRSTRLRGETA